MENEVVDKKSFKVVVNESLRYFTPHQLAGMFGVTPRTVGKWSNGKSAPVPTVRTDISNRLLNMIGHRAIHGF